MKLAIVTNNELHHKYFAFELYNSFDVPLVIQPTGLKNERLTKKIKNKKLTMYGWFWFFLKALSLVYNRLSKNSFSRDLKKQEVAFFEQAKTKFKEIPRERIVSLETVNSPEAVKLIEENEIDIICFLGGDIAKKEFISAAKVCSLNFHSGVSPFYNGNKTVFHAVKDYRPNFAGGTLMYITERIDGGGILSHYLPEINPEDTAASLFMKGIIGAVILYKNFLNHIMNNELPKGVTQQRSFKYVRNIDWTIVDDIKLGVFEAEKRMRIYCREQKVIEYFDIENNDLSEVYKRSLSIILKKGK